MEKWLDMLLYEMVDILLDGWGGSLVMEWLSEDMAEYLDLDQDRTEPIKFLLHQN